MMSFVVRYCIRLVGFIDKIKKRILIILCGLKGYGGFMVKQIVKDVLIFKKAEFAEKNDLQVARDLVDTLRANADICVGMAANMIGVNKRIIVFSVGPVIVAMINPVIVKKSKETYEAEEGCLSLVGTRNAVRHQEIEVEYLDMDFNKHKQTYSGFIAQIIQHEIDHCDGIII